MKSKPANMNSASVDEWRKPDPEQIASRSDGRDARISKTVRMRLRFSEMLRDAAYAESTKKGHRVSEADLLDEALQDYRMKHGLTAD